MATSSSGGGIDYRSIFFAHPTLTPIQGEPDADALITLKNQLKANASSVPSNLGGGNHGHLGLVLSPAAYALVSNTAFVTPAHPVGWQFLREPLQLCPQFSKTSTRKACASSGR